MDEKKEIEVSKLNSMLEDNSGGLSSTRFITLLWSAGVFLIWAITSCLVVYKGGTSLMTIPPEVVTILLGVMSLKVVQRYGENK